MTLPEADFIEGQVLLIDKPLGWTSFQAVKKIRQAIGKAFGKKIKVGHAGTLDPLASGLLVICTGKYTKIIEQIQAQSKEYTGVITLGATTPSHDLETEIDAVYPYAHLTEAQLKAAAQTFVGTTEQLPPMYSAVKKEGKRLYQYARKGEAVALSPRVITIDSFEITKVEWPHVHFCVQCGKGVYIRALAFDFGKKLSSGAHLSALRRTKIGHYRVEDARSPEQFALDLESSKPPSQEA